MNLLLARKQEVMQQARGVVGRSLWQDARRRLFRNRAAVVSMVLLAIIAFMAIFAPLLSQYAFDEPDFEIVSCAPEWWPNADNEYCTAGGTHWFGTDQVGRDLFVRVLYGARVSLAVGLVATLVSLVIGVIWGAVAGFVGDIVAEEDGQPAREGRYSHEALDRGALQCFDRHEFQACVPGDDAVAVRKPAKRFLRSGFDLRKDGWRGACMYRQHRALALEINALGAAESVLHLVGNGGEVFRLVGALDRPARRQAMLQPV